MMQAARRVLTRISLMSHRNMSGGVPMTAAQFAAEANKPKGSIVDTIGVYTVVPIGVGMYLYEQFAPEEEFEGEIPPYPYMRIRTRPTFPWGTDKGLFEVHQHVHPAE